MKFKEKVKDLLDKGLEENPSLFLIDFSISDDSKINVVLDGDNGVTLGDCIDISRSIEHNLDKEEHDFSLEVASAGASRPLQLPRQYKKNIGRKLKITTKGLEEYEATLVDSDDDNLFLEWKAREPKPIGKGKVTVDKKATLPISDVKEAIVIISF